MTLKDFIEKHPKIKFWNVYLFVEDEWNSEFVLLEDYEDYLDVDDFDFDFDKKSLSCTIFLN